MKTISLVECRTCGGKIIMEEKPVTLQPEEEIDFLIKTVMKCTGCKRAELRSPSGPKKPLRGDKF